MCVVHNMLSCVTTGTIHDLAEGCLRGAIHDPAEGHLTNKATLELYTTQWKDIRVPIHRTEH